MHLMFANTKLLQFLTLQGAEKSWYLWFICFCFLFQSITIDIFVWHHAPNNGTVHATTHPIPTTAAISNHTGSHGTGHATGGGTHASTAAGTHATGH